MATIYLMSRCQYDKFTTKPHEGVVRCIFYVYLVKDNCDMGGSLYLYIPSILYYKLSSIIICMFVGKPLNEKMQNNIYKACYIWAN